MNRFRLKPAAHGGSLVLVNLTASATRLFEVTGLDQWFTIVEVP